MDRRKFLKAGGTALATGVMAGCAGGVVPPVEGAAPKYLILACDGGGMRGYLSSLIMQRLSQDCGIFGTNNQSIDLYAGTSTGGLIALGLAFGKSIDDVVTLYKNDGAQIFSPLSAQLDCVSSSSLSSTDPIDVTEVWQALFDDIAVPSVRTVVEGFVPGNPTLASLPNKAMVTTFQLAAQLSTGISWNPLVIDNLAGSAGGPTYLYDAALSTSAAPVYFPPYNHPVFGWCSDGGLFANNPSPQAVARAIETGTPIANISLLSIGTGFTNASFSVTEAKRVCNGLKSWVWFQQEGQTPPFPLLNGIMDSVAATNDYLCSQFLGNRYLRINPVLPKSVALDDYSPATLQMFEDTATALFSSTEWSTVKTWVTQNFQH